MPELRPRDQIAPRYKWDLTQIFADDAAWAAELHALRAAIGAAERFRDQLAASPAMVAAWLELYEELTARLGKVYVYASSQYAVDTTDQEAAGRESQAIGLHAELAAASAFAEPELLAIGPETLLAWAAEDTRLTRYAHYFEELKHHAPHIRSAEVEELLGQALDPLETGSSIHSVLANADLTFAPAVSSTSEELEVAQGTIDALITHADRAVRRSAYDSYADAHLALKNTMASCMAFGVKRDWLLARARRFDTSLASALADNFIPANVYHNVLDTFKHNLPVLHRYWRVRKKALGYAELHPYDLRAPIAGHTLDVPYAQCVEWICAGLAPLGAGYVQVAREGILQRNWVDVYPNRGKTAGAFSSGAPGTSPLILMSYTDDVESLSTLAHELGHSMHSYLTWQTQPVIYGDYSIFVAEVASNFNQAMVREHLFRTQPSKEFQLALVEEALSNFCRYFFIMPTLARFELETHTRVEHNEPLTADEMTGLLADLFAEAFGDEVSYDRERLGITWAEFSTHLYANFYVYQYTTGIAAAQALCNRILAGEPGAVDAYLGFLRAGSSVFPLDALAQAGVDMSSPQPIQEAFDYLDSLVDRLEALTAR
jgi:oligoendopeptidase F